MEIQCCIYQYKICKECVPFNCADKVWTRPTSRNTVRLNIGGHLYTTTKSTLTKYSSNALNKILLNLDDEGNVFVDRDGRMFQYILEFLRNGELCLPDDFSEFDSLTKEVNLYGIDELSSCLENVKHRRIKFIEILETTKKGCVKTVLKGRKIDLQRLDLTAIQKRDKLILERAEDSSFLEIILDDGNARLNLAEVLSRNKWTCESSDFSSTSHCPSDDPNSVTFEHCYRDRWKKH